MNTKELSKTRFQFGLSTCGEEQLTEAHFRNYAKAGVKELEISFPLRLCDGLNLPEIKRFADSYGVHLWSYHLPFHNPVDMAAKDPEARAKSIAYLRELIGKGTDVGISLFILHPSKEPYREEEREEVMKLSIDSLAQMAQIADTYGAVIAVEDLPRTCLGRNSMEMKRLLEADSRLKVCFDTNHLLGQPIAEFIRDLGTKIVTTHISDYDFIDERHWLPGEGKIDWVELINELDAVGYNGPIMYEVPFAASKNIERRMLTCEDFKKNYNCLKDRLPLVPIGKPLV